MPDIPDGADQMVANKAIAWAMAKKVVEVPSSFPNATPEERLKLLIEFYEQAYKAVKNA